MKSAAHCGQTLSVDPLGITGSSDFGVLVSFFWFLSQEEVLPALKITPPFSAASGSSSTHNTI